MKFEEYFIPDKISSYKEEKKAELTNNSIYHYTNLEGLEGIITSAKLHATEISYLNDIKEFVDIFDALVYRYQSNKQKYVGYEDLFESINHKSVDLVHNNLLLKKSNVFVFSLTRKRDDLNQWRCYSNECGYQIGFDFSVLDTLANDNQFFLIPCIYAEEMKFDYLDMLMDMRIEVFKTVLNSENESREIVIEAVADSFLDGLKLLAPIFKNKSFEEECEWRLFTEKPKSNHSEFHRKGNLLVPYINFDLGTLNNPLPISEILIGPGGNNRMALNSLYLYLEKMADFNKISQDLKHNIQISNVPYRGRF